ncbi:hypothetical protein WME95_08375 [Sorangium sp. So ce327]|uniref:hypothetical protein n=1 Tax=Sorangium sp. So ce327 TaxID=3133301 RepID=UPI003F613B06
MLAALVTYDAALTLAQALLFNLPRARGAFELAVVGVAVAAPAVAAVLLWSARMHRPERLVRAARREELARGAAAPSQAGVSFAEGEERR